MRAGASIGVEVGLQALAQVGTERGECLHDRHLILAGVERAWLSFDRGGFALTHRAVDLEELRERLAHLGVVGARLTEHAGLLATQRAVKHLARFSWHAIENRRLHDEVWEIYEPCAAAEHHGTKLHDAREQALPFTRFTHAQHRRLAVKWKQIGCGREECVVRLRDARVDSIEVTHELFELVFVRFAATHRCRDHCDLGFDLGAELLEVTLVQAIERAHLEVGWRDIGANGAFETLGCDGSADELLRALRVRASREHCGKRETCGEPEHEHRSQRAPAAWKAQPTLQAHRPVVPMQVLHVMPFQS